MKYKLEDICLKITDGSHYSPSDDINSNIPMLSVKDMQEFDFNYNNCKHISEEEYARMLKNDCVPKLNDVLVAKDGSYLKEIFVNEKESKKAILSSIAIFRPNQEIVDPYFLCYLLKDSIILNYVKDNCVSGSALPRIILKSFKGIELTIPEINIQKKIVRIIKSINDKIRINNSINNNLFKLMKNIYVEWFKNYNIPNENFKFKDSKLGKIPDNWNVRHLKDIFFFQEGPGIRNWQYVEKNGTKFINIRCIRDNDLELDTANMISNEEANGKYNHFMLDEWDVVVSTSGTLGRNQIIRKEHLPLCLNTSVIRFKPNNGFDEYAFMFNYLISDEFFNLLDIMATGSAQRNFGPMHLKKIDLVYPEKKAIIKFNNLVFPIIKKIQNNKAEITKLSQLRNTLLSKLINGEINLDNIKI